MQNVGFYLHAHRELLGRNQLFRWKRTTWWNGNTPWSYPDIKPNEHDHILYPDINSWAHNDIHVYMWKGKQSCKSSEKHRKNMDKISFQSDLTIFSDSCRANNRVRPCSISHIRPMAKAAFIPRPVEVKVVTCSGHFYHMVSYIIGHHWMTSKCQTSDISNTKSQQLNVSHLVLRLSLSNPLKPGVK